MLQSAVFISCTLSLAVSQNVTSSVPPSLIPSTGTGVTEPGVTEPMTTVSSFSHTEVYLDPTVPHGSPLNLSVVFNVRSNFQLSFRTCSHGSMLSQIGGDEHKYFQLALDENGSFNISWSSSAAASKSVLHGIQLNDNQWYKLIWTYGLENITVSVEQNASVLYETLLLNATFGQDLWNLNLENGSKLQVGDERFEGCLRDGSQMWFSSVAEIDDSAVHWHGCSNETICDRSINSCSSSPCANNGRFDMSQLTLCTVSYSLLILLFSFSFLVVTITAVN